MRFFRKSICLISVVIFLWIECVFSVDAAGKDVVGYYVVGNRHSAEDKAAIAWLERQQDFSIMLLNDSTIIERSARCSVLWFHAPAESVYRNWCTDTQFTKKLRSLYDNGSRILATDFAARIPHDIGVETIAPEVRLDTVHNDWLFDQRGFQGYRNHPIFRGLFGGAYVWDPDSDQVLPSVGYVGMVFPANGKVVGVDKAYVFVFADRKIVLEYERMNSRILSVGSSIYFNGTNHLRMNLELFISNCLEYLLGRNTEEPRTFWMNSELQSRRFEITSQPIKQLSRSRFSKMPTSELIIKRDTATKEFFDLAGRRALIMGKELGGLDEVWVHPFRVLRDYQAGVFVGDSIVWLSSLPAMIEIRPESFSRTYTTPIGKLKETVVASLERGGGILQYETIDKKPIKLAVTFRSDLRWMWPYDEKALGDVHFAFDAGLHAFHIKDTSESFYCVVGADVKPEQSLIGQYDTIGWRKARLEGKPTTSNQVYAGAAFNINEQTGFLLNVAIAGTNRGKNAALTDYRSLLGDCGAEYQRTVRHYQHLLDQKVTIISPDPEFNALFKWALVAVDRFWVNTPGVGFGLVAGYSTTERGWDGGHQINGRPGYGWYFGRDAEWSGFAIDDYGDFELVRKQLEFLQHYQDRSGKIFHEISTSGIVHYDASDATPLYLLLAGHYLRASGDIEFIKKSWSNLKRAIDYLYSTDTDGDHLIENTNVGHGWVEGGKLFGVHTELYLAAIWTQSLYEMSDLAHVLQKDELSKRYLKDAQIARDVINRDFWNDSTRFFNFGKFRNGTFSIEPTVLPAVGMYLNLFDAEKTRLMLEEFAGNGFSTDWGVRIVSSKSKLFNPSGYHYGSVWPLFTGWTSLAEYEYGNSNQGFVHLSDNLYVKNNFSLGFVEEVLHGSVYRPAGVCPHQCWSETNIIHPAINGMVGWKPDALTKTAVIRPRFPISWDSVTVNNLRIGSSILRMKMKRSMNRTDYDFALTDGTPVAIQLAPEFAAGTEIRAVILDGSPVAFSPGFSRGLLKKPIRFRLNASSHVTFVHSKGIDVYPILLKPAPGDSSLGYRLISSSLENKTCTLVMEGRSGTIITVGLRIFDQHIAYADNAQIEPHPAEGTVYLRITFDQSSERFSRKVINIHLI